MSSNLVQSNAVHIPLADKSVHMCVTSPPYWSLRSYSGEQCFVWGGDDGCAHEWGEEQPAHHPGQVPQTKTGNADATVEAQNKLRGQYCVKCGAWYGALGLEPTPEEYVANMVAVFREVWRVMRDDGTLWLNLGDSYARDGGWSDNSGLDGKKRGESGRAKTWNNKAPVSLKPKDLCGIPWRVAFALQADGWYLRSDIIWSKPNPMPESVTDRPTKAHEYLFLLTKNKKYYYDADAVREGYQPSSVDRYEYTHGDRTGQGWDELKKNGREKRKQVPLNPAGRNRRTVWHIATRPYSGAHFAVYPSALVEPCIKAGTSERGVCPACGAGWVRVVETERTNYKTFDHPHRTGGLIQGGVGKNFPDTTSTTTGWTPSCECWKDMPDPDLPRTKDKRKQYQQDMGGYWKYRAVCRAGETQPARVLDPFSGAATTGLVCQQLGRNYVGLDLSAEYHQLARKRLGLEALDKWTQGTGQKGDDQDKEHKNMQRKDPHTFHKERVQDDLADLPMFTPDAG